MNDDVNTFPVVAHVLMAVCGVSDEQAGQWTQHVHVNGYAEVVGGVEREVAEGVAVRLLRYGIRVMVLP